MLNADFQKLNFLYFQNYKIEKIIIPTSTILYRKLSKNPAFALCHPAVVMLPVFFIKLVWASGALAFCLFFHWCLFPVYLVRSLGLVVREALGCKVSSIVDIVHSESLFLEERFKDLSHFIVIWLCLEVDCASVFDVLYKFLRKPFTQLF